jgi:hypothetical protein
MMDVPMLSGESSGASTPRAGDDWRSLQREKARWSKRRLRCCVGCGLTLVVFLALAYAFKVYVAPAIDWRYGFDRSYMYGFDRPLVFSWRNGVVIRQPKQEARRITLLCEDGDPADHPRFAASADLLVYFPYRNSGSLCVLGADGRETWIELCDHMPADACMSSVMLSEQTAYVNCWDLRSPVAVLAVDLKSGEVAALKDALSVRTREGEPRIAVLTESGKVEVRRGGRVVSSQPIGEVWEEAWDYDFHRGVVAYMSERPRRGAVITVTGDGYGRTWQVDEKVDSVWFDGSSTTLWLVHPYGYLLPPYNDKVVGYTVEGDLIGCVYGATACELGGPVRVPSAGALEVIERYEQRSSAN